jgi:pyruvate dehydrogenase E2 component (dihydrolipoyllysine-residue acetyltransferase)
VARVAQEIPKVGLVMENARLVRWLKNVGDTVTLGEPLLELETEKSVVEIEATASGRLVEQLLQVDQEASVGDRVAWLETDTAESASSRVQASVAPTSIQPPALPARAGAQSARASSASESGSSTAATARSNGRIRSSPVARRLAEQNGIDLAAIVGSGPRGRVQLIDVRRALEARSAQNAGRAASPQPLSSMRRALARAMTLSNATVPQFAVERAVDWTALQAARAKLAAELPAGTPKLSVNDFLLQAIARTLLSYPALNATFRGNPDSPDAAIVPATGAHIGLVVAVENGLLVPVIHGVEQLGLAELARRRSDCVDRALAGRLKQAELEGATFSLSNLGARGPDRFTAIISPPQSAILAVGRQRDCVFALGGHILVRPMSDLSLTVDHRVADGRLASEFLAYLIEILEGNEWRVT